MDIIFDNVLGSWTAFIALVALSAFGYCLYHWLGQEPKAGDVEQYPSGAAGADTERGAEWWRNL